MKKLSKVAACLLLTFLTVLPANAAPPWTVAQAETLEDWIERSSGEAIDLPEAIENDLRASIAAGESAGLDLAARNAALELMRAWRGRCCGERKPAWWHIDGALSDKQLLDGLDQALLTGTLDPFLRSIRPAHPDYSALADAFSNEADPVRRTLLAKNLARWRWLPPDLGERYLLVNIAAQKVSLWERGSMVLEWRVIVGKPATRTPVFTARVTGVVLNPWWEIPSSIAAEGIARFVRRSPKAARARGYIYQNGRYRQMPGDNNALGRMKLEMPNPYTVFLHDTSNRELFTEPKRAFSHGCIRVDRAIEFAAVLLNDREWNIAAVESQVASEKTITVPLAQPIPLYVTYFTAGPDPEGSIRFYEDIYRRDGVNLPPASAQLSTDVYGSQAVTAPVSLDTSVGAASCLS
ncbi:L,D-transpeptidase [Erythrobacter insulae]|uniref:L,D-transpeptidase n=1 Tax=Erythrobacter insulae TaxID=2584124 RepID=A0A547PBW9_9SPHN|nr:L,D-transpeptidase family protein [Erythrobacter insulae]TRD11637.1 L,D-transpeptidase [Erythrobacter insulae]